MIVILLSSVLKMLGLHSGLAHFLHRLSDPFLRWISSRFNFVFYGVDFTPTVGVLILYLLDMALVWISAYV